MVAVTKIHSGKRELEDDKLESTKVKKIQKHGDKPLPLLNVKDKNLQSGFGARLAHTDKKVRDLAIKSLIKWLRNLDIEDFSSKEIKRLWNGLYYCFWMSDKPLIQEGLAQRLASVMLQLSSQNDKYKKDADNEELTDYDIGKSNVVLAYYFAFWNKMAKEWFGIDRIRLNKYYMFIKKMQESMLLYLKQQSWDIRIVKDVVTQLCLGGFIVPKEALRKTLARPEEFPKRVKRRRALRKLDNKRKLQLQKRLAKKMGMDLEEMAKLSKYNTYKSLKQEWAAQKKLSNNSSDKDEGGESDMESDEELHDESTGSIEGDDDDEGLQYDDEDDEDNEDDEEDDEASEIDSEIDEDLVGIDEKDDKLTPEEFTELLQDTESAAEFLDLLITFSPTVKQTPISVSLRSYIVDNFQEIFNNVIKDDDEKDNIPEDVKTILFTIFKVTRFK